MRRICNVDDEFAMEVDSTALHVVVHERLYSNSDGPPCAVCTKAFEEQCWIAYKYTKKISNANFTCEHDVI